MDHPNFELLVIIFHLSELISAIKSQCTYKSSGESIDHSFRKTNQNHAGFIYIA